MDTPREMQKSEWRRQCNILSNLSFSILFFFAAAAADIFIRTQRAAPMFRCSIASTTYDGCSVKKYRTILGLVGRELSLFLVSLHTPFASLTRAALAEWRKHQKFTQRTAAIQSNVSLSQSSAQSSVRF